MMHFIFCLSEEFYTKPMVVQIEGSDHATRRGLHAVQRFFALGAAVLSVFTLSFGPFWHLGQLRQVVF